MSRARSDNLHISEIFRKSDFSGKTALVLSTWFGSGLFPYASGTIGTLAAVPLVLFLYKLGVWCSIFILVIVLGTAFWSAELAQDLLGKQDPSEVVIDEVAGFLVTMILLPSTWLALGLGFFLFRFFDVLKPYPIKQLERLKGGIGIVADDLLAGLYACAGTWLILAFRDILVQ